MKKELYFVAIIPEEKIEQEISEFKSDLFRRFHTKAAMKSPSHITLVAPFQFDPENESQLIYALQLSAKNGNKFHVQLQDFDSFPPNVLFVKVVLNHNLLELEQKVKLNFSKIKGPKLNEQDRPFHPHMTIGNRDWTADEFLQACREYKLKKYSAEFIARKISLLKLGKGKWDIVSEAYMEF